jgi:FkbM family methyltransferase
MGFTFKDLANTFGKIGAIKVILAHILKKDSITVQLKEFKSLIKFRPYTGDFATIRQVVWDQEYNLNIADDPKYIIDLGANIGISSLAFANKYPKAKIIALEPDRKNFELLCFNTRHCDNITKLNKAIWIKDETVCLENPFSKTNSFIFRKASEQSNSNTIGAITLTSLMQEFDIPRIDLLKVDIEGVENELFLQNDTQWVNKVDFISIEFHSDDVAENISNMLKEKNFKENQKGEKRLFSYLDN